MLRIQFYVLIKLNSINQYKTIGGIGVGDNYRTKVSTGYLSGILKAVGISMLITFIILLLASLLLCFTDFPENYTFPSAIASTILGVFSGSYIAAKTNPDKRLLSSLFTTFIYIIICFIIGCILGGKISFTLNTLLFAAIALTTGAIASILANRTKSHKNYNKGSSKLADRFSKKSTNKYKFNRN